MFEERVELLAPEELLHLFATALRRVHLRFHLDAMELNGFLRFGDGAVKLAFANVARGLVANGEKRQYLRVVVHVARNLRIHPLFVSLVAVEVSIILCCEALPEARARRVLLRSARHEAENHTYI